MGERNEVKVRLSTVVCVFIILVLVVALGVVYYLGFVQNNEKIAKLSNEKISLQEQIINLQESKNETENEVIDINAMTSEEATKIAQDIYNKAYGMLEGGSNLIDWNGVEITIGQEGIGWPGILNVRAFKFDFSKIEQYFTERAIKYIKTYYTDTPYGHSDGNYYIYLHENAYSHEKKDFVSTIFGTTDQNSRTLKAKLYNDDTILAVSEKSSYIELDEYLVLKKVNNTWKIDMFEEF